MRPGSWMVMRMRSEQVWPSNVVLAPNVEQSDHDRLENRSRSEAPHTIFVHSVFIIRRKY